MKLSIKRVLLCHLLLTLALTFMFASMTLYLLLFPLFILLLCIIITKGLNNIHSITIELANRAANHLEPVSIKAVPKDIKPVIVELNKLLARLKEGFEREKRFAADAAHELRTPLAALKAQAQVALNTNDLDEKNMKVEQKKNCEEIVEVKRQENEVKLQVKVLEVKNQETEMLKKHYKIIQNL